VCPNCSNNNDDPGENEQGEIEGPLKCTLVIDIASGEGTVTGDGSDYNLGQIIFVSATPKKGFKFGHWEGALASYITASFNHPISAAYALGSVYFDKLFPCSDLLKSNPLLNMKIKPTASGSIVNGDWKGRGGNHDGIDLGEEGDPIYAMFDGVVTKAVDDFSDDLIWENDYPVKTPSTKC
jgi:murein DD-endopeptidase MepM/ murein hydrolase activator NlpD